METFIAIFATLFGLIIGSFANVVILRLPEGRSIVSPPSSCPSCGKSIRWYENLPVVSWVLLRGRCYGCKSKISIQYPLTEMLCGLIAFLLRPIDLDLFSLYSFFLYSTVAIALLCHVVIDFRHRLLPDHINLYLGILFLSHQVFFGNLTQALIGFAVGFGIPYAIVYIFYKIKGKIGMGGGDIKLFGVIGLAAGPVNFIIILLLSSIFGSLYALVLMGMNRLNKERSIPFGPFIIAAFSLFLFFPKIFQSIIKVLLL